MGSIFFKFPLLFSFCVAGVAAPLVPLKVEHYILTNPALLEHGLHEGGLSGLMHLPGDPPDIVYSVSDRGANGELLIGGEKRRTFAATDSGPTIYKLHLIDGAARIIERKKLCLHDGTPDPVTRHQFITGLPNLSGHDETGYDAFGKNQLPFDPHGLDTEGLAYQPRDKTFWLCDEYGPSLVHVEATGKILQRLVPAGLAARLGIAYARDAFPAIYSKRENNRGFEGVAVSPDGQWLYAALQSPLNNPDNVAGEKSRMLRVLKLDAVSGKALGEYVYVTEESPPLGLKQKNIVVSDLLALDGSRLIVVERDNQAGPAAKIKRLYIVDTAAVTNILGRADGPLANGQTLEQQTSETLRTADITPLLKQLLLDLAALNYPYEKIEGICLLDANSIAVINDNDFSFEYINGQIHETNSPTEITVFHFSESLDGDRH